jgi:hypothetical protein
MKHVDRQAGDAGLRAITRALLAGVLVAACSSGRYSVSEGGTGAPTMTFPAAFAEGDTGKAAPDAGVRAVAAAASSAASPGPGAPLHQPENKVPPAATPAAASTLPDPEPLVTADQWEYVFDYSKGAVRVASVRPVRFTNPVATARRVGRFAVELKIGKELVDRVRFEFPLLAADPPPSSGPRSPTRVEPRFSLGAETSQTVLVPASPRATSANLIDRLTGDTWPLEWPPSPNAPALLVPE